MSTIDCIEHEGIVETISPDRLTVKIVSSAACTACHAKSSCPTSESVEKTIEVTSYQGTFGVGDHVVVKMNQSLGVKAILIGYFYPFLIMFGGLIVVYQTTGRDVWAGIASLLLLAIYFLVLKLFHYKLEKSFQFQVERV